MLNSDLVMISADKAIRKRKRKKRGVKVFNNEPSVTRVSLEVDPR